MSTLPLTFIQQRGSPATESDVRSTTGADYLAPYWTAQGIQSTTLRPVIVKWRGDIYVAGPYTRAIVRPGLDGTWVAAGIKAPDIQLAVVPGSGSGGSSGAALAYITFVHKAGAAVLAESDRSNIVDVGALTGQGRAWSNIATAGDLRVTHVRGYVSMNGADYGMAWESQIGISTVEENIPTNRLSIRGADHFTRLPPPTGIHYVHSFSNRLWYARTSEHPYRLWFTPAGQPEYVSRTSFRDTKELETITAIWKGRNELLVFCEDSCYKARVFGAGAEDVVLEKLDSDVGCLTQHGIQEVHNRVWFPARDGFWVYDGSFFYLMKDIYPLWNADFKANEADFRNGWTVHDRNLKYVMFCTGRATPVAFENTGLVAGTIRYAAYYGDWERSMLGQEPQPDWGLDLLSRKESTAYTTPTGEVFYASCDGKIRRQDSTDENDDGDTLSKKLIIRPGHQLFFEPGDDVLGGKEIKQHWHYVESETNGWTLYLLGGDEDAWNQIRPDNVNYWWKADVPASLLQEQRQVPEGGTLFDLTYCAKGVHFFEPERVAGRGFTFEVQASSPLGMKYRGFGGLWGPGHATRQVAVATIV